MRPYDETLAKGYILGELVDMVLQQAIRIAAAHDTQPRTSLEEDPWAASNQEGYLTARDQITKSLQELREQWRFLHSCSLVSQEQEQ